MRMLRFLNRFTFYWALLFSLCLIHKPIFAHGEAIEINTGAKGAVHLSAEQENMLQIKTVKASVHPLAQLLRLNGQISLLPNAEADVTVRISGSVKTLDAHLGDHVQKDQRLATIQSRLIGDPPPTVEVKSPMTGIIDARNVTIGQAVEPNTVLYHISNRDKLLVIAKVYEEDLGKIRIGQKTSIKVISYPQLVFNGQVTLIEPNLDTSTRTVNVRMSLNNTNNLLKPGMSGQASLVLNQNNSALAVPNSALLEANGEQFVFIRVGHSYKRVDVDIGASDEDFTEITRGLKANDEVVTQGNREVYTAWLTGGKQHHEDHH